MLSIRKDQVDSLELSAYLNFENRVLKYLHDNFPDLTLTANEDHIREEIRYGVQITDEYDFMTERDISKFIYFIIYFGRNFDIDPNLEWLTKIISDLQIPAETRLNQAFDLLSEKTEDNN